MCDELDSDIGHNVETQKAVCVKQSLTYTAVIMTTTPEGKDKWKKIKQAARDWYLAMLHFDGLNRNTYGNLQVEIHKAYCIGGVDALPKRYKEDLPLRKTRQGEGREPECTSTVKCGNSTLAGGGLRAGRQTQGA